MVRLTARAGVTVDVGVGAAARSASKVTSRWISASLRRTRASSRAKGLMTAASAGSSGARQLTSSRSLLVRGERVVARTYTDSRRFVLPWPLRPQNTSTPGCGWSCRLVKLRKLTSASSLSHTARRLVAAGLRAGNARGNAEARRAMLLDAELAVDHVNQTGDGFVDFAQIGQFFVLDVRQVRHHYVAGD